MTHTPDAAAIPSHIAKLIDAHESTVARIGTVLSKGSATRADLERAYASHTEPGLRRAVEIVDRQIQAYVTPNSDYSHGVMDMSKAFSKAIRTELDKLADDPIPEEWKSTPPEAADRSVEAKLHPDDRAVDRFAGAMKHKMSLSRDKGRQGWDNKSDCTNAYLSRLLREHVDKGDPIDVGNLAMMIHQRGEAIAAPSGNHPVGVDEVSAIERIEQRLSIWAASKPEDDETWESWFAAAFDLFGAEIHKIRNGLPDLATRPAPSVAFTPGLLPAEIPQHLVDIATEATSGTGMPDHDYDDDVRLQLAAVFATIRHTMAAPSMATIDTARVDRAAKAFGDATGYYVPFHAGLSSESSDKIRKGIRAALEADITLRASLSVATVTDDIIDRLCVAAFGEDEWKHMLASFDPAEFVIERMRAALEVAQAAPGGDS